VLLRLIRTRARLTRLRGGVSSRGGDWIRTAKVFYGSASEIPSTSLAAAASARPGTRHAIEAFLKTGDRTVLSYLADLSAAARRGFSRLIPPKPLAKFSYLQGLKGG